MNVSRGGYLEQMNFFHPLVIIRQIIHQPALIILIFADLFFILVSILALFNPLIRKKTGASSPVYQISIFWVSLLILYAFITSPFGGARYRIPVNPIIFLLAVDSLLTILKFHKSTHKKPLMELN